MTKKYYPNNWKAIKDADDECFMIDEEGALPFDVFMDLKLNDWEVKTGIAGVIREHDGKSGKVKEHVYSKPKWANKKIKQLLINGNEFTIAGGNVVQHIHSKYLE